MIFRGGSIRGTLTPPPSKSHTHRALLLASMADGRSTIENPLMCDDTASTMEACRRMGARIGSDGGMTVDGGHLNPPHVLYAGGSGTTLRLAAGICSMFDGTTVLDGDAHLRRRPMQPLLDALSQWGASCCSDGGRPPVRIEGPSRGGPVTVDCGTSSQFASSLLMTAPALHEASDITIAGALVSGPYLDITSDMMRRFGADVQRDGRTFHVEPTGYRPCVFRIPADMSSAAFAMTAGALGGRVRIKDAPPDIQGDGVMTEILEGAGAAVRRDGNVLDVTGSELRGCDVDLRDAPDLFPIVAVLLSTARGESLLKGAPHLHAKESDRIVSTTRMINDLGGHAVPTGDGCRIRGVPRLEGGRVECFGDHRIMMSAAVASIVCRGPVEVDDGQCCNASYPGFVRDMASIGLEVGRCSNSGRS